MSKIILSCSYLREFVDEAQKKLGTDIPVREFDSSSHMEPSRLKEEIETFLRDLPEEYDTVLAAMAFCGGAWSEVKVNRTVVIPKADDCASIMLHCAGDCSVNMKEDGHMYLFKREPEDFSAERMMSSFDPAEFPGLSREQVFDMMLSNYTTLDIIDTGLFNCYDESYVEKVQKNADSLRLGLDFARGSNEMIEKLIAGDWDDWFIVAPPGTVLRHGTFFS